MSPDACAQLIHAFVTSKVDYCNSLLVNLPACLLYKLQKVQNTAARILTLSRKSEYFMPVLIDLHWLPVTLRIRYKLLLLVFKSLKTGQPSYLANLLTPYTSSRSLRSSDKGLLQPVRYKLESYGKRSFKVTAPLLWNDLPHEICCANSIVSFKSLLKTHLFQFFDRFTTQFYVICSCYLVYEL